MSYLEELGMLKTKSSITKRCCCQNMVSYNKLWKLLIDKDLNKKELIKLSGVSSSSVAKLTKTDVLCKICETLECDFKDIMEYTHK